MDHSWSEAVRLAGWEFARPGATQVLAFVYTATVSLRVEESCVNLNPTLPTEDLSAALTQPPSWLGKRSEWLRAEWPSKPIECRSDLELYGLTSSKALLAVGAEIPDGSEIEMLDCVAALFPQVTLALQCDSAKYQAWNACIAIDTEGELQWGFGGPLAREGLRLPLPDINPGGRSAFEVFLQNQMRIDLQRRIEAAG